MGRKKIWHSIREAHSITLHYKLSEKEKENNGNNSNTHLLLFRL